MESCWLATEYLGCGSLSFPSDLEVLWNRGRLELALCQVLSLYSLALDLLPGYRLFELALLALRRLVALRFEQGRCLIQGEPGSREGVGGHGGASNPCDIQHLALEHLGARIRYGYLWSGGEIVLLSRPSVTWLRTLGSTRLVLTKVLRIPCSLLHAQDLQHLLGIGCLFWRLDRRRQELIELQELGVLEDLSLHCLCVTLEAGRLQRGDLRQSLLL